jgi:hypothetical protein
MIRRLIGGASTACQVNYASGVTDPVRRTPRIRRTTVVNRDLAQTLRLLLAG